jgi:hypothetical protein
MEGVSILLQVGGLQDVAAWRLNNESCGVVCVERRVWEGGYGWKCSGGFGGLSVRPSLCRHSSPTGEAGLGDGQAAAGRAELYQAAGEGRDEKRRL